MNSRRPSIDLMVMPTLTDSQKWLAALFSGILFAIISSPFVYNLTNSLFSSLSPNLATVANGQPTLFGLILHSIVFGLLVRLFLM